MDVTARPRRRGFFGFELVIALTLTLLLAGTVTAIVLQYRVSRHESEVRRALRLAAAEQLARARAGLIDPRAAATGSQPPPTRDPTVTLTAEAGVGDWAGLWRITATAQQQVGQQRVVTVELATYTPLPEASP
jgi:hypothetical protein